MTTQPCPDLQSLLVCAAKGVLRTRALQIGTILLAQKAKMPHGTWGPWLKAQGISQRSATRYMQLARQESH